jgi:hypothetical protein
MDKDNIANCAGPASDIWATAGTDKVAKSAIAKRREGRSLAIRKEFMDHSLRVFTRRN